MFCFTVYTCPQFSGGLFTHLTHNLIYYNSAVHGGGKEQQKKGFSPSDGYAKPNSLFN
jgi:hypothetical protein